jgi:hypothetical protein
VEAVTAPRLVRARGSASAGHGTTAACIARIDELELGVGEPVTP